MKCLFIVPHADDEVGSCGGTIAKLASQNHVVDLVVASLGFGDVAARQAELTASAATLGVRDVCVLFPTHESFLDTLPQHKLVGAIDEIADQGYEQVFYPCPGQHHHDHRALHDACHATFRLGVREREPLLIAMYEYVYPGWLNFDSVFGRLYVDITETIKVKLDAMNQYRSQLSKHTDKHPMHPNNLMILAHERGLESGCVYAEMFYVAREMR